LGREQGKDWRPAFVLLGHSWHSVHQPETPSQTASRTTPCSAIPSHSHRHCHLRLRNNPYSPLSIAKQRTSLPTTNQANISVQHLQHYHRRRREQRRRSRTIKIPNQRKTRPCSRTSPTPILLSIFTRTNLFLPPTTGTSAGSPILQRQRGFTCECDLFFLFCGEGIDISLSVSEEKEEVSLMRSADLYFTFEARGREHSVGRRDEALGSSKLWGGGL